MRKNNNALLLVAAGALGVSVLAVAVQFWDSPRFESWTREDGPVENLQAALYATAGVLFAALAYRRPRNAWLWVFAIGLLFCAGEEISWGQRIFGFATPSGLEGANIQREANLHNVENIHGNVRTYGFMALGLTFVVLPIVEVLSARMRSVRSRFGFPPVSLYVVPLAAAAFGFMLIPRYIDSDAFGFDEVGELFTALAMCAYAAALSRRLEVHMPQLVEPARALQPSQS
jgi:hypothetical protein